MNEFLFLLIGVILILILCVVCCSYCALKMMETLKEEREYFNYMDKLEIEHYNMKQELKEVNEDVEIHLHWFDKKKGQLLLVCEKSNVTKDVETFFIFGNNLDERKHNIVKEQFTFTELKKYSPKFVEILDFRL